MHHLRLAIAVSLAVLISGCAGGKPRTVGGTTVTVTFTGGTPLAVATQVGGGSFTPATLQSGKLTLTFGEAINTSYAIAYVCPPVPGFGNTVSSEFVLEATVGDGTAYTVSCFGSPATGSATGSANAAVIAGAANILVRGNQGFGGSVGSNAGTFSVNMPTGSNDVAFVAIDSAVQPNVLAVKFVRAQTVPGAINGGSQVFFAPTDATTPQSLTIHGVPAGFVTPPAAAVQYMTANGTSVLLDSNSATSYPAVPTAAAQSGDFYLYESNTTDTATHNSAVGVTQTTTTGGGAATLTLPAPWSFSGPAAATFPTFTFNYPNFNSLAAVAQQAEIEWAPTATTLTTITITATAGFQNGATTLTISNLTSLSGFFAPAASGTTIDWVADVFGGTFPAFSATFPANGSLSFVQNRGTYVQP